MKPLSMLCTYGLINLYRCLEEFVFDFCKTFWWNNPELLMRGQDFRSLMHLYANEETRESYTEGVLDADLAHRMLKWHHSGFSGHYRVCTMESSGRTHPQTKEPRRNEALWRAAYKQPNLGSGRSLCTLATGVKPLAVLEIPLIAA